MSVNHLPTDAAERKTFPLWTGLFKYFPDALAAVAKLSYIGNQQHNPGQPLHWAREKSTDQEDTLLRHLLESGTIDTDGVRHSTKVAWRALAKLQLEIESDQKTQEITAPTTIAGAVIGHLTTSQPIRTNKHNEYIAYYPDGRFVVRPAVQRPQDSLGGTFQPGAANSGEQDVPDWKSDPTGVSSHGA